jgi:streptogramin lyase
VDSANIWEIEIDSQGKIWMLNEGLVCYDDSTFTRYDTINEMYIPISFENSMTIDNDDNVWFLATNPSINCPNFNIYSFDGDEFTSYDPVVLNTCTGFSVSDIEVDQQGSIWFSFSYANNPIFVKYDGSEWTSYDTTAIGFSPRKIFDMEFDSENTLWFNDDYTFCSTYYHNQPGLYSFDGEHEAVPYGEKYYISEISVDNDDNIWVTGLSPRLGILDMNHKWVIDNSNDVGFCRVMEMDSNGDMWLGTSDGIYIYRYSQTK